MNNIKYLVLFILCINLFSSCKKPPVTSSDTPVVSPKSQTLDVNVEEIDFLYFNSKTKVAYKDPKQDVSAVVNIRMKKDSIIWLSISKAGIEVIRALIDRDSVYVMDKFNKDYYVYDFATLSKKFNFNIGFDLLQSSILGNMPIKKNPEQKASKEKEGLLLQQQQGAITIDNYIRADNNKLDKALMTEKPTNNSLTLDYEDFGPLDKYTFPYTCIAYLKYQSGDNSFSTLITINHNKTEISDKELKFPFNVRQKYERK